MSYHHDTHDLAQAIGRILLAGGEVPPADVDIGLAAYTATLDLLRQVHRDLTGSAQRFTPRDIAQAEQRPVALFGRLLADVPRLHTGAPTDILTRTPTSAAGIRWQDVARAATLAATSWENAGPTRWPHGDAAAPELADLAALTQGVLAASDDLHQSLTRAGHTHHAAQPCTPSATAASVSPPNRPPGTPQATPCPCTAPSTPSRPGGSSSPAPTPTSPKRCGASATTSAPPTPSAPATSNSSP